MQGMKCPKKLWLSKHKPEIAAPPTEEALALMETGRLIGKLARKLHPDGVFPARGESQEDNALATRKLIDEGATCIFEATLIDGGRLARADILRRIKNDAWALDEVKSSTVDDPQVLFREGKVFEVEFESQVAIACDVNVVEKSLVLIDNQYVYEGGDYDLNSLFGRVRVDAECEKAQIKVLADSNELSTLAKGNSEPVVETNKKKCKGCSFHSYCHKGRPAHCITLLPRITEKTLSKLREAGHHTIDQIPEDFKLSPTMKRVRDAVATDTPYISPDLPEKLQSVKFPAAFVDFESCSSALPMFVGTRPFSQVCFQWSMHRMELPDSSPTHSEFLFDGPDDPREEFCRTLLDAVQNCGSFLHYAAFEKTQLNVMVDAGIPYASQLAKLIEERGVDLKQLVNDTIYMKEFNGSYSIKSVLPAMVPDMSYKGMPIADGQAASRAYIEMIQQACAPSRREEIRRHLLAYCQQDTLAMVKVFERLSQMANVRQ